MRHNARMSADDRPLAATGHIFLRASDVPAATRRLEAVGIRTIVGRDRFSVVELRGGTHIVVRELEHDAEFEAGFDLMYDDIQAARKLFVEAGFEATEVEQGRIHASFWVTAPERFKLQVLDSHAGERLV